jgi:2-polyprenyl-3-methyl-5-hydroxy-6-metoxy-1,4-benzoquinol methylase
MIPQADKPFVYADLEWSAGDPKEIAVKYIPERSKVLDVGCGAGAFGKWLKVNRDCTVDGFEGHPEAVATAGKLLDSVTQVDLNDVAAVASKVKGHTYDRITFIDVLEHCLYAAELLEVFKKALTPGGQIIISVPNVAHHSVRLGLLRGDFTYQDSGILDKTHVRLYTRKTLLHLAHEAGLKVLHIEPTPPENRKYWRLLAKFDPTWTAVEFVMVCEPAS